MGEIFREGGASVSVMVLKESDEAVQRVWTGDQSSEKAAMTGKGEDGSPASDELCVAQLEEGGLRSNQRDSHMQCYDCIDNYYESGPSTAESTSLDSGKNEIGILQFRSLRPSDKASIQTLHEEWFPVRYKDEFYDCVVRNEMAGTGDPLFSCVAYMSRDGYGMRGHYGDLFHRSKIESFDKHKYDEAGAHLEMKYTEEKKDGFCPEMAVREEGQRAFLHYERIVGCIVGSFLDAERCNNEITSLLLPNPDRHSRLFYIMTLGTISEYRKQGLGSALVKKCLDVAESDRKCGVVYLHVIIYNTAAIGFYERLGFYRVKEIKDYYSIEGEHHNCYLYARYLNGNRGHLTIFQVMTNLVQSIWKRVSSPVYAVLGSNGDELHLR
mmetsp:Transcript_20655/g.60010  ORF Transcript_20655/g.60010 Transcript_20655/m.60010 type:complete len:382 (-) Transcript_20655:1351-2496(-)